jgi:hypothetical protein
VILETLRSSPALKMWRFVQSRAKKVSRRAEGALLRTRWSFSSHRGAVLDEKSPASVFDSLEIKVINLEHRTDRLAAFSNEMERLGIRDWNRIPGVDGKKKYVNLSSLFAGSIACTESHIAALESTAWSSGVVAMICEDDLEFVTSRSEVEQVIHEFLANPLLSVLCLSGRPRGASFAISPRLNIATGIVGRGCYLVKAHAAQPLIAAFQAGIPSLVLGRVKGKGDQMWGSLQRRGYFFGFPKTPIAQQGPGYSDIEDKMLGPR